MAAPTINTSLPAQPSLPSTGNDPYGEFINASAQKYGVDPHLVRAMIMQESKGDPNATSPKGAQGLMQLMPGTATDMGVTDPFDPQQNIEGGTRYIAQQLAAHKGDVNNALASYNWGPGNFASGKPLPAETQDYINKVNGYYADSIAGKLASTVSSAPTTGTSGLRWATPNDAWMVGALGLNNVLRSPSPNVDRVLSTDANGRSSVIEVINGGKEPPSPIAPFTDPSKFVSRVGWDKDGNPIYSNGAAEMAAANAGISDFNKANIDRYGARNKLWASMTGEVPLQGAQAASADAAAGLHVAQTKEEVANSASTRNLQALQAAALQAQIDAGKYIKVEDRIPMGTDTMGNPVFGTQGSLYNQNTGQWVAPPSGLRAKPVSKGQFEASMDDTQYKKYSGLKPKEQERIYNKWALQQQGG